MTQTQPYANGTEITYDQDAKAIIRGFTHLDSGIHYVLQTESNDLLFIRPADECAKATSLSQYIGDYIRQELDEVTFDMVQRHKILQENLDTWIKEALDAYEGGAK